VVAGVVSHMLLCRGGGGLLASQTQAIVNGDEISTSPRGLYILYITLKVRNLSKPDDGRYRPKHVVFYC
jgi:hypothetical protein